MIYSVTTERFGELLLQADSIKEARAMAWKGFRVGPRNVSRKFRPGKICERCESRPCCCPPRESAIDRLDREHWDEIREAAK